MNIEEKKHLVRVENTHWQSLHILQSGREHFQIREAKTDGNKRPFVIYIKLIYIH